MTETNIRSLPPPSTGPHRKLVFGVGRNRKDVKIKNTSLTWNEFKLQLHAPAVTNETSAEYQSASPSQRDSIKDGKYFVGGGFDKPLRKKQHLLFRDILTLDADHAPVNWREEIKTRLAGVEWAAYTTHSHTAERPRIRVLIPIDRSVEPLEYGLVVRVAAQKLGLDWLDMTCLQWLRLMYFPSVSVDGASYYVFEEGNGVFLSPERIKAKFLNWKDVSQWPVVDNEAKALLKRADKVGDPKLKKNWIGAFCRVWGISEAINKWLPGVYTQGEGGRGDRWTYSKGTSTNGAVVYEEKWLYSHHETDPCSGMLLNSFDLVRIHLYGHMDAKCHIDTEIDKKPSYKAMLALASSDIATIEDMGLTRLLAASEDFKAGHTEGAERAADTDEGAPSEKEKKAPPKFTLGKEGEIKNTLGNVIEILKHDTILRGCVALDMFSGNLTHTAHLPGFYKREGEQWTDFSDIWVRNYLEKQYKLTPTPEMVHSAISHIAAEKRFHPVVNWLKSLEWDGKPRVEMLFIECLGAEDNEYTRKVSINTLVGAITRVMEPGSKFDFMPILEGTQGIRKSTFWQVLSNGWFSELKTFDQKIAAEIIQGVWFAEVAELEAMRKADIEKIKVFLSQNKDRYRKAYDRRVEDQPRQCVFVGSTNKSEYLDDFSGARRFWPIACNTTLIDTVKLKEELSLIWAEAFQIYMLGAVNLFIDGPALEIVKEAQLDRTHADDWVGIIAEWLEEDALLSRYSGTVGVGELSQVDSDGQVSGPTEKKQRVCVVEVWEDCFKKPSIELKRTDSFRISRILKHDLKWNRTKNQRFGSRFGIQKGFTRPPLFV